MKWRVAVVLGGALACSVVSAEDEEWTELKVSAAQMLGQYAARQGLPRSDREVRLRGRRVFPQPVPVRREHPDRKRRQRVRSEWPSVRRDIGARSVLIF